MKTFTSGKGKERKGKFHPITSHKESERVYRYSSTLSLTPVLILNTFTRLGPPGSKTSTLDVCIHRGWATKK